MEKVCSKPWLTPLFIVFKGCYQIGKEIKSKRKNWNEIKIRINFRKFGNLIEIIPFQKLQLAWPNLERGKIGLPHVARGLGELMEWDTWCTTIRRCELAMTRRW